MKIPLPQLLSVLRPHQWAKNLLVLVAILTAHRFADPWAWGAGLRLLLVFCLVASTIYVINDALDVASDRLHPDKSQRPFASGALPLALGLAMVPVLLSLAAVLSLPLPRPAALAVLAYTALALGYCFLFKRMLWLDVLVLASLYVLRVVAGALAIAVPISPWLLGFALFLFVSLACLKRFGELAMAGGGDLAGRAYRAIDAPVLLAFGAASALTAVVVFALYVQSPDVRALYRQAALLWLAAPVLLFWLARLWTLAGRGQLRADPILFALRDGSSYVSGAVLLAVFWAAL